MKKLLVIAFTAGILAACGSNDNPDRINKSADSINNMPSSPDTSQLNTDTSDRKNPNHNQDSLRYN